MRQSGEANFMKVKRWWIADNAFAFSLTDQLIDFMIAPNASKITLVPSNEKAIEIAKKYSG